MERLKEIFLKPLWLGETLGGEAVLIPPLVLLVLLIVSAWWLC